MANPQQTKVEANLDGLNNLLKSLKQDYFVRVGILGAKAKKTHKNTDDLTNAKLGTIHEQPDNDHDDRQYKRYGRYCDHNHFYIQKDCPVLIFDRDTRASFLDLLG